MAPTAEVSDGFALRQRLEMSGATVMQATPATWAMLIEAGWSGNRDLRVLCGGEAVDVCARRRIADAGEGGLERLRSNRDDNLVLAPAHPEGSANHDRPPDRQYAVLYR